MKVNTYKHFYLYECLSSLNCGKELVQFGDDLFMLKIIRHFNHQETNYRILLLQFFGVCQNHLAVGK